MLRVGLTGGLASGKSTAAHLFAALGVHVIQADEVGRAMMQPGHKVFEDLVSHFGVDILANDGSLDRRRLAELAFRDGRLGELNLIVHPPVIAEQEKQMAAVFEKDKSAIVMIESALIFEAGGEPSDGHGKGTVPGWRQRFDRIILVIAPAEQKTARYIARAVDPPAPGSAEEKNLVEAARLRLEAQIPDEEKIPLADYIINNNGPLASMKSAVTHIYGQLKAEAFQGR